MAKLSQQVLLGEKGHKTGSSKSKNCPVKFSITFSRQYNQIVNIVKRHLPMLSVETSLHHVLNAGVRFMSRRAPTLANMVFPSVFISATALMRHGLPQQFFYGVDNETVLHAVLHKS